MEKTLIITERQNDVLVRTYDKTGVEDYRCTFANRRLVAVLHNNQKKKKELIIDYSISE